jgi:hypothetical protein
MGAPYELAWDIEAKRIRFAMHGTWDGATMSLWSREYRAAVLAPPGPRWTVLADMTDYPPQSESIQKGHEELIAFSAQHGMVKAIMVVPKAVAAMQMKRLVGQAGAASVIGFVSSIAEAEKILSGCPV